MNKNLIDDILTIHPEAKNKKEGFPNVGCRLDKRPFSDPVKKNRRSMVFL